MDGTNSIAVSAAREKLNPSPSGILYAVAIYPYMAKQEDRFDVVVPGWCVARHDPNVNGIAEADEMKQGWVPADSRLETSVSAATAIQAATAKGVVAFNGPTLILPLTIGYQ
ncbi:hypothetical protein EIP86_009955 [Pleurotus ostreatoroseus]|nr:hypothetical protein EIP86_009955 [Pleurotus ostreatoroseus]